VPERCVPVPWPHGVSSDSVLPFRHTNKVHAGACCVCPAVCDVAVLLVSTVKISALQAVANIGGREMAEALAPEIQKVLLNSYVAPVLAPLPA
jgi:hypothetical protein